MIAGGLQTQVYVVSLGGWDTYSYQTVDGTPEEGRHNDLLSKLSDALYAFQDDLRLLGVEDDVIGLVFSEFGRRIKSNASFGTDHGTAWPAMLFGSHINPTILGSNPAIPAQVEKKDNLFSRSLLEGKQEIPLDLSTLDPGTYYLVYINGIHRETIPFLKL